MSVTGTRYFKSYTKAERFCDEWAGDTSSHVAIVEDPGEPDSELQVMDYAQAEAYIDDFPAAEIIYHADCTPERFAREG
jgi:hypothetical protein